MFGVDSSSRFLEHGQTNKQKKQTNIQSTDATERPTHVCGYTAGVGNKTVMMATVWANKKQTPCLVSHPLVLKCANETTPRICSDLTIVEPYNHTTFLQKIIVRWRC